MTTHLTTAADALRDEEVERTRAFLRAGWVVAIGVVVMTLAGPGDRRIAESLLALVGLGVIASVVLHRKLRDPEHFDRRELGALAVVCVLCGQLGILYVGYFSAAPAVTVLGIYFFCRTESTVAAIAMYALAAGGHLVEATLIITGVIDDPGFYHTRHVSIAAQLAGHFVVQCGYLLGFVMARLGRTASLSSIEALQEATRLAAQREEQVNELRQDLDRALKIGGPGRFTGHVVGVWELGAVLGRGAMGEVYEAVHVTTREPAAVKLLRRELLGTRDYVERFLREVRAASALDSPNVVRVLDASTPEDPIPFLTMERLRGRSLGEILRASGTLASEPLAELVVQVADVLERARAAGIVHRDIKPHNLFLTDDGVWKVLDFGVAHVDANNTLTRGGAVVGTPAYMAPEQAKGEAIDHRVDVYALAAVIYRCVTGRAAFFARDTPALLYAVVHQMPIRPGSIAPLSSQLDAFLAIGLAKPRDARFQTAAELATAYAAATADKLPASLRQRARALPSWHEPETAPTQELVRR